MSSASPRDVCSDIVGAGWVYGTSGASREFPASPMLAAPTQRWSVNQGWWGVWAPFLIDNKMLTGSCNNDDNKGLSALDMRTGKTLWLINSICDEGNRCANMGEAKFFELDRNTVLLTLGREDGKHQSITTSSI